MKTNRDKLTREYGTDEIVALAIEVTAAPNSLPDRRKSVLPRDDARVGSTAMLDKEQTAIWFENWLHLRKGFRSVRNGAQRPRHHDGVDALIGKRQRLFGRLQQEINFGVSGGVPPPRHFQQCQRRFHANHALNLR